MNMMINYRRGDIFSLENLFAIFFFSIFLRNWFHFIVLFLCFFHIFLISSYRHSRFSLSVIGDKRANRKEVLFLLMLKKICLIAAIFVLFFLAHFFKVVRFIYLLNRTTKQHYFSSDIIFVHPEIFPSLLALTRMADFNLKILY